MLLCRNVCTKQLPIDANVLCQIVELLCAAYAVAHRLRMHGNLHDLTLSRKWLSRLYADGTLKDQGPYALGLFISVLPPLLWELYMGSSSECKRLHHYNALKC